MCCPLRRRSVASSSFDLDPLTAERADLRVRPRRRRTMSQTHNCAPLFSFFECEQQARIKRNLVIQACIRGTMRAFAQWLRVLVLRSTRWARGLAAKQRLRSAVRELQRLDDRMLRDIGVTRGEIESAVHDGRPLSRKTKPRAAAPCPFKGRHRGGTPGNGAAPARPRPSGLNPVEAEGRRAARMLADPI